jgi:riboflavin biosynthesis pyrimidine reductase
LSSGIVDKIFFYYAPKIIAAEGSISFAAGALGQPRETLQVKQVRFYRFEDDVAIEGYLRDPYAE